MPSQRALVFVLFFASGFAALLYQVLWMRELGRLFGNGAHAVATTLAAFFLGVAIGSHVIGRLAPRMRRPLLAYAGLEVGIAASALLYFALLQAYAAIHAPLYERLGSRPGLFLAVKFALSLAALLPPAFFMGGTLPVMSQHLVRGPAALGRTASALYAVNTLGAALGAWLAGFELVRRLGVHGAYALAVATSLAVAAVAARAGRAAQDLGGPAGRTVGELAAWNTLGAVAGALAAGFVLLDALGLWPSLRLLAAGYLAAALLVAARRARPRPFLAAACALGLAAVGTRLDGAGLPRVRVEPEALRESIVEVLEGSGGTVAVIDRGGFLRMKLDNHYGLGGTDDVEQEERQALLPLALHPRPRSVFLLGLGSGITAGAALRHPLERLVVAEISPQVIEAARRHFQPWLYGLFDDPRARIRAEDARTLLGASRERFDLIVSDLFLPWLPGAGSLYSVEAYRAGRERLEPGGLYAQWLTLFQLSDEEFATIARTMADVFPQLTLWRGNLRPSRPIALLVGSTGAAPLDPEALRAGLAAGNGGPGAEGSEGLDPARALLLYQGDLGRAPELLAGAPLERDVRPRVEYRAAIAHREKRAGRASAFVGEVLVDFYERVFDRVPPEGDPYLARIAPAARELPRAGLALLRARALEEAGDGEGAAAARNAFSAGWERGRLGWVQSKE